MNEFEDLVQRFIDLDQDEMEMEDHLTITLEIVRFMKKIEPIIDKYNPKYKPPDKSDITDLPDNMDFKFNEFWKFIDGEQDGA